MKSIRNFAYALLLTLSALNFAPSLASAQDEGGRFTLPHDVRWENVVVPAGEYRFSLQPMGPSEMLKLTKTEGTPASFMLVVSNTETGVAPSTARLVISSKFGVTYVSAMDLPEFEMTLHFNAPANSGKELASAATTASGSAQ
jgi:hypothetical protein